MKTKAMILAVAAMAMFMTGCATAVTSYNVTYGQEKCPLKVMADTSVGVSVHINDNSEDCIPIE